MAIKTTGSLVIEDGNFETDAEAIKIVTYKDQTDCVVTIKTAGGSARAMTMSFAFMITMFNVIKEVKQWHPEW